MTKFEAIYNLVDKWDRARKPLKKLLGEFFKENENFSYSDQAFIKNYAFYKIKHFIYLRFFEEYADKKRIFPPEIKGIIRDIFVLFVHGESRTEADELISTHLPELKAKHNELFISVKFHFKRFEEDIKRRSPLKKQLYVLNSYAREIVDLWLDQYSDSFVSSLMQGFNLKPQFSLRVNLQKNSVDELRKKLEESGIFSVPSVISPNVLNLRNPVQLNIFENKELKNGDFLIQDESEVVLNQLHYSVPKELILDLNPTNGNFFISYALDSHHRCNFHAICHNNFEVHSLINKIKPLKLTRFEIKKVESNLELYQEYSNRADTVFVRPNSLGLGRLKSEPDRKWNISRHYLSKVYDQQQKQLAIGAKLIKSGGKLIYISDSFNKMENESAISRFLVRHTDFSIETKFSLQPSSLRKAITPEHYIKIHPKDFPFNSYFAAILRKA